MTSENFVPPLPDDLKALHSPHDRYPPSQSKRWLSPPSSKKGKPKEADKAKDKEKERHVQVVEKDKERDDRREKGRGAKDVSPERRKSNAGVREYREPSTKDFKPESARQASRRPSSHGPPSHGHSNRPVSITVDAPSPPVRDSQSPMTFAREPKRRSTMNSRDAAIEEEEMRRAIEESRRDTALEEGEEEGGERDGAIEEGRGDGLEGEMEVDEALEVEEHEERAKPKEKGKGKARRDEGEFLMAKTTS